MINSSNKSPYYIRSGKNEGEEYHLGDYARSVLYMPASSEKYCKLTDLIVDIACSQGSQQNIPVLRDTEFGGVKFSSVETLISYSLFMRASTLCNLVMNDGDASKLNEAFMDINFAMHYSLCPEMLGLCSLYRAYFLPKGSENENTKDEFVQNELNIVKRRIDSNSSIYTVFVGDFPIIDQTPSIYYYFISFIPSDNSLYKYSFNIGSIDEFAPMYSENPYTYISNSPDIDQNIKNMINSKIYLVLSKYKIDKKRTP